MVAIILASSFLGGACGLFYFVTHLENKKFLITKTALVTAIVSFLISVMAFM